ncbi:MAG: outer membrane protein assembly factor BamB [Comamonadaceae bacterium]|nr:outer membrane protein assembly factor BamB [Comamonadaceae bacterium]
MSARRPLRPLRPLLALALVGSLTLSGCSLWGGSSKPQPLQLGPMEPVLAVRQAWSNPIGAVGSLPLQVHVQGTQLTLASASGTVAALDARTGADVWRTQLGTPLTAGVGSDGRHAAVVSANNELIVLDQGREAWRQPLTAQSYTAPLVAGARVFVLTADRTLAAYDAASGQRLWRQQRQGEPLVLREAGLLTAVGDTLVTGVSGRLVGINPDNGTVRWESLIATSRGTNDVERLVELVEPVSRAGNSLCARAFQAGVGCVHLGQGNTVWSDKASGATGVAGDEQQLFGTESNGLVQAWRRNDGSRTWSYNQLQYRKLTAPLLLGRSVVVGDDAGWVHLLSAQDGQPLNRFATDGSGIAATPVQAGETLVVVTRKGAVYGFRPD